MFENLLVNLCPWKDLILEGVGDIQQDAFCLQVDCTRQTGEWADTPSPPQPDISRQTSPLYHTHSIPHPLYTTPSIPHTLPYHTLIVHTSENVTLPYTLYADGNNDKKKIKWFAHRLVYNGHLTIGTKLWPSPKCLWKWSDIQRSNY